MLGTLTHPFCHPTDARACAAQVNTGWSNKSREFSVQTTIPYHNLACNPDGAECASKALDHLEVQVTPAAGGTTETFNATGLANSTVSKLATTLKPNVEYSIKVRVAATSGATAR